MEAQARQQRCQIIQAPERPQFQHKKSIFLAGSTARTDHSNWREVVKEVLSHLPVTILDPYRPDWDSSWKEDIDFAPFREQVEWELDMQEKADTVVIFFHPSTQAPISLLEFGLWVRARKVIAACPEGYWKRGHVQIACQRFGITLAEDLGEFTQAVLEKLGEDGLTAAPQ